MDGISRSRGWDKEIPHCVLPMEQLVLSDKWARNTYETFSLHLQNSIRDGEVGNYLFLTDVRIQREIGGLDTPPPIKNK